MAVKDKDYWEQRAIDSMLQAELSVLDFESRLIDAYATAIAEIQKELNAFFGKYAKDNKVVYSEARRRLNDSELSDFRAILKAWMDMAESLGMDISYYKQLEDLYSKKYVTRLESLQASIEYQIQKVKKMQETDMKELASINYMVSYYESYFTLTSGLPGVSIVFDTIDAKGIENAIKEKWEGGNYSSRIWADRDSLVEALKQILPQSFSRGLNANKIGDMIAKKMNTSKNRGRALARTEINYLSNKATLQTYDTAGVEEYEFLATLDMLTSDICRDMDGYVGKVTQAKVGVNYPPMHTNCRSTTVPKLKEDMAGDRIAKDAQGNRINVPRRMTQEEWIKKYVPEDQQEKMLQFKNKYRPKE